MATDTEIAFPKLNAEEVQALRKFGSEIEVAEGRMLFSGAKVIEPGFGAGDARSGSVKRVESAVGEGSMSVSFVHAHIGKL
jgi:hypothetical protein